MGAVRARGCEVHNFVYKGPLGSYVSRTEEVGELSNGELPQSRETHDHVRIFIMGAIKSDSDFQTSSRRVEGVYTLVALA